MRRISAERLAAVELLIDAGLCRAEIATRMDLSESAIARASQRLGRKPVDVQPLLEQLGPLLKKAGLA